MSAGRRQGAGSHPVGRGRRCAGHRDEGSPRFYVLELRSDLPPAAKGRCLIISSDTARRKRLAHSDTDRDAAIGVSLGKSAGSNFFVAQFAKDLEDLAPCRKHPAASLLVFLHGQHEFHLGLGIFAFTGCGVDKAAPAALLAGVRRPCGLLRGTAIGPGRGLVHGCCPLDR